MITTHFQPPPLKSHPELAEAASQIFYWAMMESDPLAFLRETMALIGRVTGCDSIALIAGAKGQWRTLVSTGVPRSAPAELLAEALDEDEPAIRDHWFVSPLVPHTASAELLAAYHPATGASQRATLETLLHWWATALSEVRSRQRNQQRITRLSTLLEIASQWQQTQEMEVLLQRMAEAATKLFNAQRASIFLWDRPTRTLVGRPALGVEGGELRIPDNAGVVGQVIQTGQPRRVDADVLEEQREIDRRVDQRLKFQTKSLLCVPLRARSGDLFGAFELINKTGGNFTSDDEEALAELAAHAAVALENTQQLEQLLAARQRIADEAEQSVQLIGDCPAVQALRSTVTRVAGTELAVLV